MNSHELCRLCMGKSDGVDIFPSPKEDSEFARKIAYTVGIRVKTSDGCHYLCMECKSKIEFFFDYKVMCQKTEKEIHSSYTVATEKCETENFPIKVKLEPDNECLSTSSSKTIPGVLPIQPMLPLSIPQKPSDAWPQITNGMVFPCFAVNSKGQMVQVPMTMPAMVPVGEPIPLSSFKDNALKGLPIVNSLASVLQHPQALLNNKVSVVNVKEEILSDHEDVVVLHKEQDNFESDSHSKESCKSPEGESISSILPDKSPSDDSEDLIAKLDLLIDQVFTDDESRDQQVDTSSSEEDGPTSKPIKVKASQENPDGKQIKSGRSREKQEGKFCGYKQKMEVEGEKSKKSKQISAAKRPRRSCVLAKRPCIEESESDSCNLGDADDAYDPECSVWQPSDASSGWDSDPDSFRKRKGKKSDETVRSRLRSSVKNEKRADNEDEDPQSVIGVNPKPSNMNRGQMRCNFCPRYFLSEEHLKVHEASHADVKNFPCFKCESKFRYRFDLERHEDSNHASETWECRPCFVAFAHLQTWRAHVKRHKVPYTLEEIFGKPRDHDSKLESKADKVDNEERDTSIKKPRTSVVNPSKSKTKSRVDVNDVETITINETVSNEEKQISCILCKKDFENNAALIEHMKVHGKSKGPPYFCKCCNKKFQDRGALICHEIEKRPHRDSKIKILKCKYCEETFKSLSGKICHEEISHRK